LSSRNHEEKSPEVKKDIQPRGKEEKMTCISEEENDGPHERQDHIAKKTRARRDSIKPDGNCKLTK